MIQQQKKHPQENPTQPTDETGEPEVNELDFKHKEPSNRAGDLATQESVTGEGRYAGLTGGAIPDTDYTADDLTPDTMLDEDRTGSPLDNAGSAADETLQQKELSEIGAGEGFDEAELARARPLDGKPWDEE